MSETFGENLLISVEICSQGGDCKGEVAKSEKKVDCRVDNTGKDLQRLGRVCHLKQG